MIKYFAIAFLSLFVILSSCTKNQKDFSTEQLLKEIDEAIPKASEQDDQITFWKDMLNQERYASDRVAKASINYQIGKSFAPLNIDSAEVYTTKALILIEDEEGFENEKTAIYNGLGNIAKDRGKIFLSSFYYHKIVSILDANPFISTISAKNKIRFYLHSAQSNTHIGLSESAFELNKKAEQYLSTCPNEDYLWFRVYSQLFLSGYQKKINEDSLRIYLKEVEKYAHTAKENRFVYEHKANFLLLKGQFDSAKVFNKQVFAFDKKQYLEQCQY